MRFYVAGPMRGYKKFNFPMFDRVSASLRKQGHEVANPAEHDREVYPNIEAWLGFADGDIDKCPEFNFAAAMHWDLAEVIKADAIALLPGWEQSSGARTELFVAQTTGRRVYVVGDYAWGLGYRTLAKPFEFELTLVELPVAA